MFPCCLTDGPLLDTHDVFGLRGQMEHKMTFLKRHVPRDTKLVLIGHSIGCYIILEMMRRDPQLQVRQTAGAAGPEGISLCSDHHQR